MLSERPQAQRRLPTFPMSQPDAPARADRPGQCRSRDRDKIDVGVGVFRDGAGNTPILKVIKEAEQRLLETQETKAYLGGRGDKRFAELLRPIVLGDACRDPAHRRGADARRVRRAAPRLPAARQGQSRRRACWSARRPGPTIRRSSTASGSRSSNIPITSAARAAIRFDAMMDALGKARGRRHRPAPRLLPQSDRRRPRRRPVGRSCAACARRAACMPFVDIAYQGLGRGLDEDAAGLRRMLDGVRRSDRRAKLRQEFRLSIATASDRCGSRPDRTRRPRGRWPMSLQNAREMWSMPPDHGAAAVRIVLEDPALRGRLAGRARRDARAHQRGRATRSPPPTRAWPLSAASSACSRCCRSTKEQVLQAARERCDLHGRQRPLQRRRHGRCDIERFIAAVVAAMDS